MKKSHVFLVFIILICLFLSFLYLYPKLGLESADRGYQYMNTVFNQEQVTNVDIEMADSDFDSMIKNASDEEIFEANVTVNGTTVNNVGIRTKGNLSLRSVVQMDDSERYSFKIDFDYYDSTKSLDGLKKLNLNNNYSDASQMREYMSYKLMEQFGIATPGYSYMYVSINGEERGLYLGVEAIEETFLARNFDKGSDSLYKPDGTGSDLQYISENYEDYSGIGAKTSISDQDEEEFLKFINAINEEGSNLASVLDIDEMLRYFAANTAFVNMDSYQGNMKHNYYLYEEEGIFSILPWDYNMSFGGFGAGGAPGGGGKTGFLGQGNERAEADENHSSPAVAPETNEAALPQGSENTNSNLENRKQNRGQMGMGMMGGNAVSEENINLSIYEPVSGVTMEDRPLVNALLTDEENITIYEDYLNEIATTFLDKDSFTSMVEEIHTMIKPYVEKDPTAFFSVDEFEEDVYGETGIIEFASQRSDSLLAQLSGELVVQNNTTSLEQANPSKEGNLASEGMKPSNGEQMPEGFEAPEGMEPPNGGQMPEGFEATEGMEPPSGGEMPEGFEAPEGMKPPNDGQKFNNAMPGSGREGSSKSQSTGYSKVFVITSAAGIVILLALIFIVNRFKRRRS